MLDHRIYIGNDETFLQFGKLYELLQIDNICFVENDDSYLIFTNDDFVDKESWRILQLEKIISNETKNLDINR